MKRFAVLAILCAAMLVGCTSHTNGQDPPPKPGDEQREAQAKRVRDSFETMKKAIVEGDTKTYFSYLSQAQQAGYGSYDVFLTRYAQEGNGWREMWRTAEMPKVVIDGGEASTEIRWATMGFQVVVFILENGVWHLHYPVQQH